jgi:DNA-binding NarL/FixJ family response regulator
LLRLAAQGDADLALVDLNMPGMDGIVGLRRLRDAAPTLPIVVASGQEDPMTIRAVLAAGAVGFIPKSERSEVLLGALRLVQAGGTYVPSRLLDSTARPPPTDLHSAELTPRQLDVLRCLLRGEPNKLIARELGLTEGTVKIHIAAILRALHARNRTEAVVRARALGIAREA